MQRLIVVREELIPLIPGRPPILYKHGQVVYLSVIDAQYLTQLRTYKRLIKRAALEDPHQTGKEIRKLLVSYANYRRDRRWYYYTQFGLMPPDAKVSQVTPPRTFNVKYTPGTQPPRKPCGCRFRCACHRRRRYGVKQAKPGHL